MKLTGAAAVNEIHTRCDMQVKVVNNKTSLKNVPNAALKISKNNFRPLAGKVFYLDLPVGKGSENLEKDIQTLGGTIESFLSKDISYLISNKKEAKFAHSFGRNSPVPSPESAATGNSSPHPSSRKGSQEGNSHRTVQATVVSRGKSLVKKVIREQEVIPVNSVLSNALAWGVRILFIDDIKSYIEKKKKELSSIQKSPSLKEKVKNHVAPREAAKKTKAGILKKPFIKVEDRSRHYRPLYLQLPNFPVITYHTPRPYSPFDMDKKKHAATKVRSNEHYMTKSEQGNEMIRPVQTLREKKKKKGYCECCIVKYDDLALHLKGEQHRKFAEGSQYQVVDNVISQLMHNFLGYKNDIKRPKYSAGLILNQSAMLTNAEKGSRTDTELKGIHLSASANSCYTTANREIKISCTETKQAAMQQNSFLPNASCTSPSFVALSPAEDVTKLNKTDTESRTLDESVDVNVSLKGTGSLRACAEHKCDTVDEHTLKCQSEAITYQKRKQDGMDVCPAKYSRLVDSDPAFCVSLNTHDKKQKKKECLPLGSAYLTSASPVKKGNTLEENGTNNSPYKKLYRKVKFSSSRQKRGNYEYSKQKEQILVSEETISSSSVEKLFELFQSTDTSSSEFWGFTCSSIEDYSSLWSLFAHSSYSSFYGF
ncbi:protein DBF4 homolog A [Protopterus annectens]|uniref:protein DBF4 homolog A n=1 Tax=Protopterus annectens TaxID=7888 RepID=UPI001CF9DD13|nr:protein DBF4 homolog A [Protopterus annectens]XP_043923460.1 protein DBF4 homolog A [Protopterus annectens]